MRKSAAAVRNIVQGMSDSELLQFSSQATHIPLLAAVAAASTNAREEATGAEADEDGADAAAEAAATGADADPDGEEAKHESPLTEEAVGTLDAAMGLPRPLARASAIQIGS